jgi:hypothetical protein
MRGAMLAVMAAMEVTGRSIGSIGAIVGVGALGVGVRRLAVTLTESLAPQAAFRHFSRGFCPLALVDGRRIT